MKSISRNLLLGFAVLILLCVIYFYYVSASQEGMTYDPAAKRTNYCPGQGFLRASDGKTRVIKNNGPVKDEKDCTQYVNCRYSSKNGCS